MERTTFEGWAILELMGHRRLGGYVREEQVAGAAFIRIDVPGNTDADTHEEREEATQFYAPGAVYCITPTTEGRWARPQLPEADRVRDEDRVF